MKNATALSKAQTHRIRDGEIELAYALHEHPDSHAAALTDARRHANPNKLQAVALLCYASADDDLRRAKATLHLAIGLGIADRNDDAAAILRNVRQADDLAALVIDLTDAITHRPEHAETLATLIRILSEDEATPRD